ncbi:RHS repeat-associated core domain protein, partial [Saprospira grandis DSM 2844]
AREGMGSGSYASAYQYDQLHRIVSASNYYVYPGGNWKDGSVASNTTAYGSSYSYDANGNILSLSRYAGGNQIDDLSYHYIYDVDPAQLPEVSSQAIGQLYNNQLQYVTDGVGASTVGDLTSQPGQDGAVALYSQNYVYDEIGNLVRDSSEQMEEIVWNVQGKVQEVRFEAGKPGPSVLQYEYDPMGNRLAKKKLYVDGPADIRSEGQYYVRDPQGNVLAVYQYNEENIALVDDKDSLYLEELHLYGSARLGILKKALALRYRDESGTANWSIRTLAKTALAQSSYQQLELGRRRYELSNHLGNVLATISDKSLGQDSSQTGQADYYLAQVSSASLYYPFGWEMPGRKFVSGEGYRFGFNGKEGNPEIADGNLDFGARNYDGRIGRWWSADPLQSKYPGMSPYNGIGINPIIYVDPDGQDIVYFDMDGNEIGRTVTNKVHETYLIRMVETEFGYPRPEVIEAPMPNVIEKRVGSGTRGDISKRKDWTDAQKWDHVIAAETAIFNYKKNQGILELYSRGGNKIPVSETKKIPDLDPTLIKSLAVQESGAGILGVSDLLTVNHPGDWNTTYSLKTPIGLKKDQEVTEQESIYFGIRILASNGFTTKVKSYYPKTEMDYKFDWDQAIEKFGPGGAKYKNDVKTQVENSRKAKNSDYNEGD